MKPLLTLTAFLAMTSPALAQQNCAPRDATVLMLQSDYGESPVSRGLAQGGGAVRDIRQS